jgi:hypothetical protein
VNRAILAAMPDLAGLDPTSTAEAVHYVAIRRLQDAYADVVTRRAWSELDDLFVPDAVIELDTRVGDVIDIAGPHALGEFIADAIERFTFFEFVVLNTRIEIGRGSRAGTADARLYMCELRVEGDTGRWNNAFGVYHDRYRLRDTRWWFEQRRYHSLARPSVDGATVDAFEFPHHLVLGDL